MGERRQNISVRITFEMDLDEYVPMDWDDSNVLFYLEENHCIQNLILEEARRIKAKPGFCNLCCRASVKVLSIDGIPVKGDSDQPVNQLPSYGAEQSDEKSEAGDGQ